MRHRVSRVLEPLERESISQGPFLILISKVRHEGYPTRLIVGFSSRRKERLTRLFRQVNWKEEILCGKERG